MAGNEFDPTVMPSARAARVKERRMLISTPAYSAIFVVVALLVLGAAWLGVNAR